MKKQCICDKKQTLHDFDCPYHPQNEIRSESKNPFDPASWGWKQIEWGGVYIEVTKFKNFKYRYELYGSEPTDSFPTGVMRITCEQLGECFNGNWPTQKEGEVLMKLLEIEKQE